MVSLWWEEVDSYKSESERACTHSEASSTERWFRRNAPRGVYRAESTIPSIKKDTAIFLKEVDSLGIG